MLTTKYFEIDSNDNGIVDLTDIIEQFAKDSGFTDAVAVVQTSDVAAGILISDNGCKIQDDLAHQLKELVPSKITFKHQASPLEAAGRLKSTLFGSSVSCILKDGSILGRQQGKVILLIDYDGPRNLAFEVSLMR